VQLSSPGGTATGQMTQDSLDYKIDPVLNATPPLGIQGYGNLDTSPLAPFLAFVPEDVFKDFLKSFHAVHVGGKG
jgi:hypothetical protein